MLRKGGHPHPGSDGGKTGYPSNSTLRVANGGLLSLRKDESELVGSWTMIEGRMAEDETSKRIRALVSRELRPIAVSSDGWDRLYEDPQDHRLWELSYPSSEVHGGGPPALRVVEFQAVKGKYKLEST